MRSTARLKGGKRITAGITRGFCHQMALQCEKGVMSPTVDSHSHGLLRFCVF